MIRYMRRMRKREEAVMIGCAPELSFAPSTSDKLGVGGFSTVYRATLSNDVVVAVKVLNDYDSSSHCIENEMRALETIPLHDNIIAMVHVSGAQSGVLVLELAEIDLHDYMHTLRNNTITEDRARELFSQMVCAVAHCHRHRVAHRDIKLENWLLLNDRIKLSDFGLSTVVSETDDWYVRDKTGTAGYMSPEAIHGRNRPYDARSADAWSTAVCLFAMLSGFFPYQTADNSDRRFKICYRRCDCLMTKVYAMYKLSAQHFSADIKDLLHRSLCVRLQDRLSIEDMRTHHWNQVCACEPLTAPGAELIARVSRLRCPRFLWRCFPTVRLPTPTAPAVTVQVSAPMAPIRPPSVRQKQFQRYTKRPRPA